MIPSKYSSRFFSLFLLILLFASCEKVNINFGETGSETDPNITYIDGYKANIATFKVDSFLTSSHSVFSLGYHDDPDFGVMRARSFAQINLPASNTVYNVDAIFDSLELIIKPTVNFYGDSNVTMKLAVHRLTENIVNSEKGDYFYNTSSFAYDPVAIGARTVNLYGRSGTNVSVKLSDQLGREWLEKLKTNHTDISSADAFIEYFKGICITTDSVQTSSLAYFTASSDSMLIRLTYHEPGLDPGKKYLNFSFSTARQFNQISFRPGNANFSSFISNKTQLIASAASGNKSFLNTAAGSMIKISFPDLLTLKELHPYIKIMKAVLLVKPDSHSSLFPYLLPAALNLYTTDETNSLISGIYDDNSTPALQTGNLYIDALYGENTSYSYDITSFINTKLAEGQFSKSALLLSPSVNSLDAGPQRLIVNDQTVGRSVQLKLYVLGL